MASAAQAALPTLRALPLLLRYLPLLLGLACLLSAVGYGWPAEAAGRDRWRWRQLLAERGLVRWGVGLTVAGVALVAPTAALRWAAGMALGAYLAWLALAGGGRESASTTPAVSGDAAPEAEVKALPAWVYPLLWAVAAVPLWFPAARMQATALALLLVASSLLFVGLSSRRAWPGARALPALLLLLVTALISAWRSVAPALTLPKLTGLLLGLYGYWALWRWREAGGSVVAAALAVGALTLGFALVGLAGGLRPTKVDPLGDLLAQVPPLLRSLPDTQGGRISLNQLAGTVVHVLPVMLALAACPPGPRGRAERLPWGAWLISLLGAAALLGTLVLTQSRAGYLGLLAALLVLLAGQARWGLWALLGVVLLGLAGWAVWGRALIVPQVVQALVGPLPTTLGTVTLRSRVAIWEDAASYILRAPWLGQGLGTYRLEDITDLGGRSVFDVGLPHAHNVWLGVAYDLGLPGLTAYLSLLLTGLLAGGRALARLRGPTRQAVLGALAGLAGAHTYGMLDAVALGAKPGVVFWLLLALIGSAAGANRDGTEPA